MKPKIKLLDTELEIKVVELSNYEDKPLLWQVVGRQHALPYLRAYIEEQQRKLKALKKEFYKFECEALKEDQQTICPECMDPTSTEELDMFGGFCEECNLEY